MAAPKPSADGGSAVLIAFDDYPVHQTQLPLAHAGGGNPDQYDRFWFNGFRENLIFGVAYCIYPGRQLVDGAFSVVSGGVQRSVFASARAGVDPVDTRVGPLRIEIVEPMRVNRVIVDAPEHGLRADLTYTATTAVVEEARQERHVGPRTFMNVTRATQWGAWTGTLEVDGELVDLGEGLHGTKDRSWGTRTVHGTTGAPAPPPEVLFLWAPLHFGDECFHFLTFENPDGSAWAADALVVPTLAPGAPVVGPGTEPTALARVEHRIRWQPGTRRAASATLIAHTLDGGADEIELEPLETFHMKGLGYNHPTWGHGVWHDELAVAGERYEVAGEDPMRPENLHVQQLVRARWRGRTGLGVLEQVLIGRHTPYGFREFLDPARGE